MILTESMKLVEVDKGYFFKDHPIEHTSEYRFWVDNSFYVLLRIEYKAVGESAGWHIPIVNFGYQIEIEKHDVKRARFSKLSDVDSESGLSTKKYFSDPLNRSIVRKIIGKNLLHYIRRKNPPVIIRGPMTPVKRGLSRYYEITEILDSIGFQERIFRVDEMPKDLWTVENNECEAADEMWIYVRDECLWKELEGWTVL